MEEYKITVSKQDLEIIILTLSTEIVQDIKSGIYPKTRVDLLNRIVEALKAPF